VAVPLDERSLRGPPAQRLDPQPARAGKQVQHPRISEAGGERIEQRLFNHIRGRTDPAAAWRPEPGALRRPRRDAHRLPDLHVRRQGCLEASLKSAGDAPVLGAAEPRIVREEGRGVPTIIEMVTCTRLDCAVGSAGLMRLTLDGSISGRVTHRRSGTPAPRTPAMLVGPGYHNFLGTTETDGAGRYRFTGLFPATYNVMLALPPRLLAEEQKDGLPYLEFSRSQRGEWLRPGLVPAVVIPPVGGAAPAGRSARQVEGVDFALVKSAGLQLRVLGADACLVLPEGTTPAQGARDQTPGLEQHTNVPSDGVDGLKPSQDPSSVEETSSGHTGQHRHVRIVAEPGTQPKNAPESGGPTPPLVSDQLARPPRPEKCRPDLRHEEHVRGSHPGDRYIKVGRTVGPFRRKGSGILEVSTEADAARKPELADLPLESVQGHLGSRSPGRPHH